jgi:hypothetical protein
MSMNFGIRGKPLRFVFLAGSFEEGGRGTVALCARKACGNAELKIRRTGKIV